MKAVNKFVVVLLVGVFSSVFASAMTTEAAYLESCRKEPGVPVPVAVVSPAVGAQYNGGHVHLEFLVDIKGRPAGFSVKSASDDALIAPVVAAVKQWKFLPAEANGVPVATKVLLPVQIVEPREETPWFLAAR
jgi:protein TonB